jgi:cell division septation protein DedD
MAYFEPIDPPQRPTMSYRRLKRRSHRGLAVVLAVGVMAMSAGALWIGYRLTLNRSTGAGIPLIQADIQPVKVKPDDPRGMEIPNRDRLVYNQKGAEPAERLLPPPEAPLPRPATGTAGQAPPAPGTALPAQTAQPPAKPPTQAQAAPAPIAIPPQTALAGIEGKGFRLQVGAVKTPESARQDGDRIKRQNSDLLGSLSLGAERVDLGDRGIFYRIQVGPIADGAEAERLCAQLRRRNVGCLIVKP